MARHFTKANIANGYAAMGNSLRRPRYASAKTRDVAAAIAAARATAARMAKAQGGKKK